MYLFQEFLGIFGVDLETLLGTSIFLKVQNAKCEDYEIMGFQSMHNKDRKSK